MKLSFNLNRNDMWIFGRYAAFRNTRFKLSLIKNILLFAVIILLYSAFSKFNVLETILLTVALVAGYVYIQFMVLKMKITKAYSSKGAYIGDHVVELTDQGIMEYLPVGEDFHAWGDYVGTVEHRGYLYILWGKNTGNVIPLRSFKEESEKKKFIEVLNGKIKRMV